MGHRMGMLYKVPLRDVVYLKSRWCHKLKKRNTGVPTSCIYEPTRTVSCTTVYNHPPVITFGALNYLSPGVLYSRRGDIQRTPVVKRVTFLG